MKNYLVQSILACLFIVSCQISRPTKEPKALEMIEKFTRESIEKKKANEEFFLKDSIYFHVFIEKERVTIGASSKEYYFDLTSHPSAPPSMPDVIEQIQGNKDLNGDSLPNGRIMENLLGDEDMTSSENQPADSRYNVFHVDGKGYHIILYVVNQSEIDLIEQLVSPWEIKDISAHAHKYIAIQDELENSFIRMSCVFDVDSIGNLHYIKNRIAD